MMWSAVAWVSLGLRFVGMTVIVAMLEEVFFRSALMRSLYRPKTVRDSFVQILTDIPGLGSYLLNYKSIRKIDKQRDVIRNAFNETPVGAMSVTNILVVGILWCLLSHITRDWPATMVCALGYAWVVYISNRGERKCGLGPAVWAHAITNGILLAYVIYYGDWRFL